MPKRFSWSDIRQIFGRSHPSHPRQTTIHRGLTSGMILIVVATILLVGLPSIGVTWWQLEYQIRQRVLAAQTSTQALYAAEQKNTLQLVQLLGQRPTLCALLQASDHTKLADYLGILRQNTSADTLAVITTDGQIITSGTFDLPPVALPPRAVLPYADLVALGVPPGLAVVAVGEVASETGCEKGSAGQVVALRLLDQDFMQDLRRTTGLEQSLIVSGHRVATSFRNMTDLPLNPDASFQVLQTREACCTTGAGNGETYYIGIAPLLDARGQVAALSEVALPADAIRSSTFKSLALFLSLSVLVALGSIVFAWQLTRRITEPLKTLTHAAERMGAGDLDTPIPVESGWTSIDLLASQLDRSRRNLKQIQQIARRELKHILHLLSATREGILTLDEAGIITWANADACRLLGYDLHNVLRKHYKQIFPPAPGEMAGLDHILTPVPGQPSPGRITILNGQGSFVTLSISLTVLKNDLSDGGQPRKERVLILQEVGEEQALARLRAEFLGNVAHEFRTPLSSISASTELLLEEGSEMEADELAYLARTINLSVVHLQALVNNLLESAIIEAGVFRLRLQPIHITELVHNVTDMMLPLVQRRQQQLVLSIQHDVPSQICADMDRLKQALVNLIENASKFSPPEAIIILSARQEADILRFSVLDCGPGLPNERFENLFSRFFTGNSSGSLQYGIGLGLPIVKAIAEAHGGQAGAANRPEGGAQVWFTIPLGKQQVDEESNDENPGCR